MELPIGADHGQGAQAVLTQQIQGFGDRPVRGDTDEVAHHRVSDLRRDVRKEIRLGNAELLQDKADPLVERTAAGRAHILFAQSTFQLGVGHSRADRIHVGVAVSDDDRFHSRV